MSTAAGSPDADRREEADVPWFPDFAGAVQLVRKQTAAAGQADPVAQYIGALNSGDESLLETAWPGHIVVYDPRSGAISGHRQLRHYMHQYQSWLGQMHARTEPVASTVSGDRAVVELLAILDDEGADRPWPIAVVVESPDDQSVVFRTYCRQWPLTGPHHVRPPVLQPGSDHPADVAGRFFAAQAAGDVEAAVATFAPDGYFREPTGPGYLHRGAAQLRPFFTERFSAGGGLGLECCAVTDDGVRCALEFNCVRWGSHTLPPQAGLVVYERSPDGLLAAVRVYEDIEPPV
jgi:hypothetical protein